MYESFLHELILGFSHEFSQIMDHSEYGKVHIDLVHPFMPEAPVLPVELDLSENNLQLYRPPASVPQSLFRGEHLPCLSLVPVEIVVPSIVLCPAFDL